MKLTEAELATILAGLRLFQNQPEETRCEDSDYFLDLQGLTDAQIDDLCERINCESDIADADMPEFIAHSAPVVDGTFCGLGMDGCGALAGNGYGCTRVPGHEGPHVAHGSGGKALGKWPQAVSTGGQ